MKQFLILLLCLLSGMSSAQNMTSFTFHFETAKDKFSATDFLAMSEVLDTVEVRSIKITASADDVGSESSNQALSQRRADFAKNFLMKEFGLTSKQIEVFALGEIPLKDSLPSIAEERAKNRQVNIDVNYSLKSRIEDDITITEEELVLTNVEKGDKIRLQAIQFEGGKDIFLPSAYPVLNALVQALKNHPEVEIEIQGHICCEVDGREGVNLITGRRSLSVDRAKAVYDYLVDRGIEESRLSYIGFKSVYITGINNYMDRRVEILIK